MEQVEKRGRPRVERADPDARTPVSIRLRGEIFNRINEAAKLNNRPLSLEIEHRLENSFSHSVVPAEHRKLMMLLASSFLYGGPDEVIRTMYAMDDLSPEERELRRLGMLHAVDQLNPPKYVFEGDEP
jgi:hypothetical protein